MLTLKKSIVRIILRVLGLVANASLFGFMSRSLTTSEMGSWVMASAMTSVVMSLDLGISNCVRNKLVANYGQGESIFQSGVLAALFPASLYLACGFLMYCNPFAGNCVDKTESYNRENVAIALMLISLRIPLSVAMNSLFSFREEDLYAWFDFSGIVLSAAAAFALIVLTKNLRFAIVGFYLFGLITCVIAFVCFIYRRKWRIYFDCSRTKEIFSGSWPYGILQIVSAMLHLLPAILVGAYIQIEFAPPMRAAMMVGQTVLTLHLTHAMPIWTEVSCVANDKNRHGLKNIQKRLIRELLMLGSVLIAITPFGNLAIEKWTGREVNDNRLFPLMMVWTFGCGVSNLFSLISNGLSKPLITALAILPGGVMSVILSIMLSSRYKTAGVGMAFAMGSGISAILMYFMTRRLLTNRDI